MKSNLSRFIFATSLLVVVLLASCKKDEPAPIVETPTTGETITITDDGNGIGTTTWKAINIYVLDGFCFVNDGQTLTIEAGTVIKAKSGEGADASALIIAKGGKIMAEGTATKPIIFTAEADDLKGNVPNDARGLWGGVIVLGKAVLNTVPTEQQIEGIPTTELRGSYGGTNDADNSGVLKYISIRHGGTNIGEGNEINGLTLGAVGAATQIDYIEILSTADDGIECFGGKPNLKHVVINNVGDDGLDYDQGFRGNVQFYLVLGATDGDKGAEQDGGTSPEDGTPYALPTIYNATYIGDNTSTENSVMCFRDNAGGNYYNSIFVNFAKGIDIEKLATGEDSYNRFSNGELKIENNVFYNINSQTSLNANENTFLYSKGAGSDATSNAALATYFTTSNNSVANPGVSASNPVPTTPQTANMASYTSGFDAVTYKGAFGTTNWAQGWTLTFE